MSAKPQSSDPENSVDPYLPRKDPELEKKVDALMNINEPDETPPVEPIVEPTSTSSVPEVGGVPLLPTDKLPDLTTKKSIKVQSGDEPATIVSVPEATPASESLPKPVALSSDESSSEPDTLGLEDSSTSKAVEEIIASEADELLIARDRNFAAQQAAEDSSPKTKSKKRTPKFVKVVLVLLILGAIAAVGAAPMSRYFILNKAGVRSASSVKVLDETTGQPLKNVDFSIAGTTAKTDAEGNARVEQLKLGPTTMTIKKPAFAEISQSVTVGWGSNPLGEYRIKAVGIQYKFTTVDFLSKKPIAKAEVTSGPANARSNDKGEIVLTLPEAESNKIKVQISAEGYRTEIIELTSVTKVPRVVQLVPPRKHVFISKRAGTFDVYKIDVDGRNEEKVMAGTGKERSESIALATHPSKNIAALVSNREAGKDGKPSPSTLTIINLDDNSSSVVVNSERVQLVDWIGNKLIYVKIANGQTPESTTRHRLVSYDLSSKTERELASSNYFNDVVSANGSVYYSPAAYQVNGSVGLYKVNAEGNYRKTIYEKEVWNLFRTAYDKLNVSIGQEWFELTLDTDAIVKASGPPPVLKSRVYFENPGDTASLWIDERDGKGVMLSYDHAKKEDTTLLSQGGLKNPIRWVDGKHIIYRVNNNQETADYIFNTEGGQSLKIRDVTDTAGIDRWYYY